MHIFFDLEDLRYLDWSKTRHSSGTAGTLLKSQEIINGKKVYYKLSGFDIRDGIIGHECVNELIADRLLTALGIEHLDYELVHALVLIQGKEYETYICRSYDYKKPGEKKIALDAFYEVMADLGESPYDFCERQGWLDYIYNMFVVDYLILNRDRHGANIEVLKDIEGNLRLAPLFDQGLSLLYDTKEPETLTKKELLEDKKVMDFIGSGYTFENLSLIPKDKMLNLPANRKEIIASLFDGIDDSIMEKAYRDKIGVMISERWKLYEVLRNKK